MTGSREQDWDVYWLSATQAALQDDGGARDAVLERFWRALFEEALSRNSGVRWLDLACGNGAVTGFAMAASSASGTPVSMTCVDYSAAAIEETGKRHPGIVGIACDIRHLPFEDQRFDVVVSQFGIEYAGDDAFDEAARLVAPGGLFSAIVHLRDGAIYRECRDNFDLIERTTEAALLERARGAFAAGFELEAGRLDEQAFRPHDTALAKSVQAAAALLSAAPPSAARQLVASVYRDLAHMYPRLPNYTPQDVFDWLDRMSSEFDSYRGRMASMLDAARDEQGILDIAARLESAGLSVCECRKLGMGADNADAAWVLVAERPAQPSK